MTTNVETINYFAAIPGRALQDEKLSGLDFRVLGVVAGHDRMGRNGQACWAKRDTMAERVGCSASALSGALSRLVERGYLEQQRDPGDGRRTGYRVLYEQKRDAAGIGSRVKDAGAAGAVVSRLSICVCLKVRAAAAIVDVAGEGPALSRLHF